MDPFGPEFLDSDEVRAAVTALDIGALFQLLQRLGVTQRKIAELTGQSQSEVCAILKKGRQVSNVFVLRRIADGFGISRARMFLGYGGKGSDLASVVEEVSDEVKRRILLAAMMNEPFLSVRGEPITLGLPTDDPLPSRLIMADVHEVRTLTDQLVGRLRYYGGQTGLFGEAVRRYTRWMAVPGSDEVKAQLAAALAELHTEAGWACHDSGLDGTGYFTHGLPLAHKAKDTYTITYAAWRAGAALVRNGYPNDALKQFQLGDFWASKPTSGADDPRLPTLIAWLNLNSATTYALMGGLAEATRHLAMAHDGWEPRDTFERAGTDRATAAVHLDLGQLDTAEQFATSALRGYSERWRVDRTINELLLAEIHVRAGEPQGLIMARHAIDGMRTLHSVATRQQRLIPLAAALEARPNTETRELARVARKVAVTRI
ncbi:MAG: helix-turn-helix transcriptional regulator [Pseudonocardiaceae bacterium]